MGLVTRCPKCDSEYEVTADQLKLHDGLVRCGHCAHVFDGFAYLKDALPTLTRKLAAKAPTPNEVPVSTPVLKVLAEPAAPAATPAPAAAAAPTPTAAPTAAPPAMPVTSPADSQADQASREPAEVAAAVSPLTQPITQTAIQSPVHDGPFVPSVDRQSSPRQVSPGRQEPGLGVASSPSAAAKSAGSGESIEPVLGSFDHSLVAPDHREPTFGTLARPASASGVQPEPTFAGVVGESRVKGDDPSAFGRTVPDFLEDDDQASEGASVMWLVGAIVLALALIAQSLFVFRNDIVAAAPSLRPLLVQLCKPVSCDVSYVRQIDRIFIVGSALQQAPDAVTAADQRAYVLRLTLQNRSAYPQPWPALLLTLTDASGTAVIKKALLPSTFLPPDLLDGPMAPRQESGLDIPLVVEGLNISGYELERFFP